jgi:hypothetical protein
LHLNLATETRTNVKAVASYGVLPGATGENILVIAHFDGFWEAAVDNASGVDAFLLFPVHTDVWPVARFVA